MRNSCREGLSKPPAWTKRRIQALDSIEEQPKEPERLRQKTKPKTPASLKPDRRLKQLEELHKGTNVNANIQLQEGRRIKLQDDASDDRRLDGKKRPAPNFDLAFADVTAGETAPLDNEIDELDDSGDELPDPRSLLASALSRKKQKPNTPSSSTRYTDPEFDDLIRNMPSSALGPAADFVAQEDGYAAPSKSSPLPATFATPKRRRNSGDVPLPPSKRPRTAALASPIVLSPAKVRDAVKVIF